MPRSEMHARVDEALAEMAIGHLRGRRLATLSGGERQRVQLAAVLATRPRLVALDEPTSQLDPEGAEAVLAACRRLARSDRAVVVAEHRLETLLPAAARVLRVDGGRVAEGGAAPRDADPPAPAGRGTDTGTFAATSGAAWELRGVAAGPAGRGTAAVLEGVDLAGMCGEVLAVMGPNGSGKTTLLRTLAGLIEPLAGSVRRPPGRTAYLPQNPGALLHLPSVRAEVDLTLRRTGGGNADDMLVAFGLTALANRYTRDLSSGERQRAALAATLAGAPSLVLLDEPTRGMDPDARNSLVAAVRGLAAGGAAVVVATHDEALAAALAGRTILLRDGAATERPGAATERPRAATPRAATPRAATRRSPR
jgi:energy-coupling factor transporter ATP-binding protein EcfA2